MSTKEFNLIPFADELTAIWDQVVFNSKNGVFLHLRNYINYHSDRFNEQSVLISRNGKYVAVFPCNRVSEQIVSHGGLTYAGLIYGVDLSVTDIIQIFEKILKYFELLGCSKIIYKAIPHIFHKYSAEEDLYALFRLGAKLIRRDLSSVIQIENRPKLSRSREKTIRKAKFQEIEICEGQFFEEFHLILEEALIRHGKLPVHTVAELRLLNSRFPLQFRLFGAFKNENLLACTLLFDFGHVVHIQNGINSEEGRIIGALDYLYEFLITEKFNHYRYFSFGISTEKEGSYLNEGLVFQKEGFGGRSIVHDFYELDIQ